MKPTIGNVRFRYHNAEKLVTVPTSFRKLGCQQGATIAEFEAWAKKVGAFPSGLPIANSMRRSNIYAIVQYTIPKKTNSIFCPNCGKIGYHKKVSYLPCEGCGWGATMNVDIEVEYSHLLFFKDLIEDHVDEIEKVLPDLGRTIRSRFEAIRISRKMEV